MMDDDAELVWDNGDGGARLYDVSAPELFAVTSPAIEDSDQEGVHMTAEGLEAMAEAAADTENTCPVCGAPYDHSRTERGTATPRLRPDAVACKSEGVGRERTVYVHLDGTPPAKLGSSPVTTLGPDPVGIGVPPFDPDDDDPTWLLDEAAEEVSGE